MLPALPTGSAWMSGASPSWSTISNAAVFWPSMRDGVDAVDQSHRVLLGELAGQGEAVVEVAVDLEQPGAVRQRLAQLAERDLALRDENRADHSGAYSVGSRAGAGVAGGGADDRAGSVLGRLGDGHGHATVLEGAGGVGALDLQPHLAAGALGDDVGPHQRGAPLAQRDHRGRVADREPIAVLVDDSAPLLGLLWSTRCSFSHHPHDRRDLPDRVEADEGSRRSAASCLSRASWVTISRLASSPWPSWRSVSMLTSCSANTAATEARTPALSARSRAM